MSLQPSLSPFLLGNPLAPNTLEFYYDIVCPFSKKSYANLYNKLTPEILNGGLKDKVKVIVRLHPQPWHASSMLCHEAVLAVARVAPECLWQYLDALYQVSETFYDIPASNFTPVQLRNKLVDVGQPIIGDERVAAAKDLLLLKSTPNGGTAVTDELKYNIKVARQNGVHPSPSVLWNGLIAPDVQSSWGDAEWAKFFEQGGLKM